MISNMLSGLRWNLSLGVKFFRVVPFHTVVIILLTLGSQVAAILASLLPLKVVILLGSDRIPRYFPDSFSYVDRDVLIGGLSAATLGFFLLHLFFEKLIGVAKNMAIGRLFEKSHKMVLFDNQDEIAAKAYQRYSRALAGGIFVFLALSGLSPFYPSMVLLIVSYGIVSFLFVMVLGNVSGSFGEKVDKDLASVLQLIGGFGFFVAFGYLIVDFTFLNPPGFFIAIISLIASRQITQRAAGAVGDVVALRKQQLKLDALFFHGKALLPEKHRPDGSMWALLEAKRREEWIRSLLHENLDGELDDIDVSWFQTGVPNVASLKVLANDEIYLVKVFEVNRKILALHEAALVAEPLERLPSLRCVCVSHLSDYHCHLYRLPTGAHPAPLEVKELVVPLKTKMLAVEPPVELVERFKRSKPMLWQRLENVPWDRLEIVAETPECRHSLSSVYNRLSEIRKELESLPVAIVAPVPNAQPEAFWVSDEEEVLLTNWGRWSIEPVGAGWFDKPQMLSQLSPALAEASQARTLLVDVLPARAELAALSFALEHECGRQRYVQALEVLPLILERLELCGLHQVEIERS